MRVIALTAAVLLASMPYNPPKISADVPEIFMGGSGCNDAQANANAIAHALGFSYAAVKCDGTSSSPRATLEGAAREPQGAIVPGLIAYSDDYLHFSGAPQTLAAEMPASVPFVATTGKVVGYVKLDALLVAVQSYDLVQLAFALEEAGIARSDIVSVHDTQPRLIVRVRPLSASQLEKIAGVARRLGTQPYWAVAFVSDCSAVANALAALAVMQARSHAEVMAQAAGTRLGQVAGVVDSGTNIPDATCGIPKNASTERLVTAALAGQSSTIMPHLYATVMRTVSVAWKLDLPPNPTGRSWRGAPEFQGRYRANPTLPTFIADGLLADGGDIIAAIEPNRVTVSAPGWTRKALNSSRYAAQVTDPTFGMPPFRPAIDIRASGIAQLKTRIDALLAYLAHMPRPKGATLDTTFVFRRDDCNATINAALFQATRNAMAKFHGHVRFLEELDASAIGPVSCVFEPGLQDSARPSPGIPTGAAAAEVTIGYSYAGSHKHGMNQ